MDRLDLSSQVPRVVCLRRDLGALTADPASESWRGLPSFSLGEAVTGNAPNQPTHVKLAWAASELRVLFQIEDDHTWATLTERDAPLYSEEVVELFLDPVGDLECYFEIEINPLNTVLDLVLRRNRSGYVKDVAWRCDGLRTAVSRHSTFWCAELSIPFDSITSEPPSIGARWRANFLRIDRPRDSERELSAWSPTGRANFHVPERFGIIEFA